ncbi:MAG: AbrB/MazE/SpoVT family DNA-binding domain-containing protein [Firmicutes bacterium]|jgi:transcriptional pleiotropic regulator of transition state genes|nr:AbrB/MazE/SpoVT family DNA-binding domain-containing protein [Bacillota bacterium]
MKTTGIIRRIDALGRIVLPIELRRSLGISQGDALEIFVEDDKIILTRYECTCTFCGGKERLHRFRDKEICASCWSEIRESDLPEVDPRQGIAEDLTD